MFQVYKTEIKKIEFRIWKKQYKSQFIVIYGRNTHFCRIKTCKVITNSDFL